MLTYHQKQRTMFVQGARRRAPRIEINPFIKSERPALVQPKVAEPKARTFPSMFIIGQKVKYLRGKELLKGVVQGVCVHMDKELVTVRRAKGVRTELCIGGKDGSLIVTA